VQANGAVSLVRRVDPVGMVIAADSGEPRNWTLKDPHVLATDAKLVVSLERIRAEYLDIPGLRLTKAQVQRLWGLDPIRCDALLETLIEVKFLTRTHGAQYVRADGGC
jgi:hypothetical protein